MKFLKKIAFAVSTVAFASAAFADGSGGPDYSAITSSVNATTVVAGISAIAAVLMLPRVAKWGYRQVMGMMK